MIDFKKIFQWFVNLFRENSHIQAPLVGGSEEWIQPIINNVSQDWLKYLSLPFRTQWAGTFDEDNCATRAAIECLEALLNFYLMNNLFPDNLVNFLKKYYCNSQGYVKLSIRYNSKLNNTTTSGASVDTVWNNFARDGMVPESIYLDPPSPFTWEQYYATIPTGIENYGSYSTILFQVLWKVIQNNNWNAPNIDLFRNKLISCPIYFAGKIGNRDANGIERWQGIKMYEHARLIYEEDGLQEVLDSYTNLDNQKYLRKLSQDFPIPCAIECAIKII